MDVIAERRLVAIFPDNGSVSIHLQVGRPTPHPQGDWVCPVRAEGLRVWKGRTQIFGVDSWHALMLGLRFIRSMLHVETERGATFHWEDGEQSMSVEELFVLGKLE